MWYVLAYVPLVLGLILLGTVFWFIHFRPVPAQRQALQRWAQERSLTITKAEHRLFFRGSFMHKSLYGVFRISVTDSRGRVRQGYAQVGGFWGTGDSVEVRYDREPESDVDVPDVDDIA